MPLEIEFEGYPLSPGGIQWEINSYGVPKSLSVDTATSSSVVLSGDSLELGDIVTATVNVFDTSTASTASTVVVIRKSIIIIISSFFDFNGDCMRCPRNNASVHKLPYRDCEHDTNSVCLR